MDNMNPNVSKKSSICRYFAADGICFYGEECQFVHCLSGNGAHTTHSTHTTHTTRPQRTNIDMSCNNYSSYHNNDTITSITPLAPIASLSSPMSSLNIDPKQRKISSGNNGNNNTHASIQLPIDSSPQSQSMVNYFVSESIKQEVIRRQSLTLDLCQNGNLFANETVVDMYEDLCPLESSPSSPSSTFNGMISSVYRGTNIKTGQLFTLRRIHGFQPNTANAKSLLNCIESWKKLQHSNIVQLKQVFTTKAFGDNSVVFVYDYHVGAETLMTQYFSNTSSSTAPSSSSLNGYATSSRPYSQQKSQRQLLPEGLLWNYIIQLSSALRTIHSNGLASRAIDPTKIIITSGCAQSTAQPHEYPRLRLSGCGVFDVLTYESFLQANNPKVLISHFQQEDLVQFGKLCLVLACNSLTAGAQRDNWQTSLELISRNYSTDLRSLIIYLLSYKPNSGTTHTINDIMPMIGARFYTQLDSLYQRDDTLVDELIKEIDNGRLLRLLTKLGAINERPEFQMDPNWSETGDRYMLKLFRDYLFHQLSEDGRPWIELGHIVTTLNKLDIGSQEKICLISRDEQNILIVSFLELKRCLDSSLNELMM